MEGECDHSVTQYFSRQKLCELCGELLEDEIVCDISYNECRCIDPLVKVMSKKDISKELSFFDFNNSVKDAITSNFQEVVQQKPYRKTNRTGIIVAAIFHTLLSRDDIEKLTMEEIGSFFQCPAKKFSAGNEIYCKIKKPLLSLNSRDLVPRYIRELGVDESYIPRIQEFVDWVKDRKDVLSKAYPQILAAAAIYCFLSHIPRFMVSSVDGKRVASLCKKAWSTVNKFVHVMNEFIIVE